MGKPSRAITNGGAEKSKTGHARFLELSLSSVRPSRDNDKLYRPVDLEDPEIVELATSIQKHGLREPIVVTLDHVILSGHRRFAAHKRLRLRTIRARVDPILSDDPKFLTLLREHNRQRVKSFDEVAREEALDVSPEEGRRFLTEHREARAVSALSVAEIRIEGVLRRSKISKAKMPMVHAISALLSSNRRFWPYTVRRVHYGLLNDPPLRHASKPRSRYKNDQKSYNDLTDLLLRARLEGHIPWEAINDPTRSVLTWGVHPSPQPFIRQDLESLFTGYYRDLLQSQPNHIEIVGEKNTIEPIIRPVAEEHCMPVTIGRGYSSGPPRLEIQERFNRSGKEKLVLLFLSDFDPEGEDIAHSFARSMRDDFGIDQIVPVKVALTGEQVEQFQLPHNAIAKEGSSRRKGFVEKHGEHVFELEALQPEDMQELLREAINSVLDIEIFNREIDAENRDAAELQKLRARAIRAIGDAGNVN